MDLIITIIIALLCVIGCSAFAFSAGSKIKTKVIKKDIDITSTIKDVLPVSEFSSFVYHYTAVISHHDAVNFLNFTAEKKGIFTIDGCVKFGFIGKEITIDYRYNNIILNMPKIIILSHDIYPETFNIYDEKTTIFNKYNFNDINDIQLNHKATQIQKIENDFGLFIQAEQSAEHIIYSLLSNLPGVKDKSIIFKWEDFRQALESPQDTEITV